MISKRSTIYDTENKKIRVSLLMLDWSVREQLFALDWLNKQDALRETYEIIWIEIYDRILPEALEKADQVITCNQRGLYHKHKAWNEGVLCARGDIVTLCDGDAVFSPDFVSSIVHFFEKGEGSHPRSAVLMHH